MFPCALLALQLRLAWLTPMVLSLCLFGVLNFVVLAIVSENYVVSVAVVSATTEELVKFVVLAIVVYLGNFVVVTVVVRLEKVDSAIDNQMTWEMNALKRSILLNLEVCFQDSTRLTVKMTLCCLEE